jgi:exodeoxyribonuclease-3
MLLVSANVNGIRAAVRRGGLAWLEAAASDVLTLQEVRASDAELRAALAGSVFEGWHVAHSVSGAKGRAGVAVLSRTEPVAVRESVGMPGGEFDGAGRWVEADGLIPIEGVVAVWKSPALSSGLAIVDEVSEPTRGSHRGVRVIR